MSGCIKVKIAVSQMSFRLCFLQLHWGHAQAPDQGSLLVGAATSYYEVYCETLCSLTEYVNAAKSWLQH